MSTWNKVLIAALVVQLGLALAINFRAGSAETVRRPTSILPDLDLAQVSRISIYGPPASGTEPAIVLEREGEGEAQFWRLTNGNGYPAQAAAVSDLLDKLASLRSAGPVVTSAVRHQQLEVSADEHRRKLVVETPDGNARTIYVGKPSRARLTFVRVDGSDDVFAVGGISDRGLNLELGGWVDTVFLQLSSDQIAAMRVENYQGQFEFARSESGGWRYMAGDQPYPIPEGKRLNFSGVGHWIQAPLRLSVSEPAPATRTLDNPLAVVTLQLVAPMVVPGAMPSEPVSEVVIEVDTAPGNLSYYVRLQGEKAAIVLAPTLQLLVEMNEDRVLVDAED
ncbi:DUF4340 domain-containing protein [Haliangium ochraceum]|uniref:DUF4340 domain-containing protein n=1 Tax=Haliangium ochraceum (strain DSM 14365 / JCM 11303 / SMP-2) TaxID=502025 RepID=D0LYJ6_HALO1|nr:DUF4340 domain-containing protein [Haliangium ochraceum]ACY17862.1 hypothetical protein Hoch_5378 [Haliangium ochraceum DSM 14365]